MTVNSHNIEFGYELISALPYAYHLYEQGKLTRTISGLDTECLYWFSPEHEINPAKRSFKNNRKARELPNLNIHQSELDFSQWSPPPLKERYQNDRFVYDKPILCICNKYCVEWLKGPVNYFDIGILREMFEMLQPQYHIVYFNIRGLSEYEDDDSHIFMYDFDVCREYGVTTIHDLHEQNPDLSFNTLQLMVMANSKAFITLNGGYSQLASYMGGTNIIYSRKCREIEPEVNSYYRWYHKFGGSRIVHVDTYVSLMDKVESIYVNKDPLINILIRTSGRPRYFKQCIESIYKQNYHNYNIIVGADDPKSAEYVQSHKCLMVRYDYSNYHVPNRKHDREYGRKFKYNLYFNELHKHVKDGYILYLDDDNMLSCEYSLRRIAEHLKFDRLLFFRVQFPKGKIPSDPYFANPPEPCQIDSAGFCFHYSFAIDWEPYKMGDYRVAKKLYETINEKRHVDMTPIKLQRTTGHGGFGRRDDLPPKFKCPICSHQGDDLKPIGQNVPVLRDVIGAGRRNAGCPGCGSSDRERLVYLFLLQIGIFNSGKGKRILHVAPEKRIYNKMSVFGYTQYVACDLDMPGMMKLDITNIPYPDNHFDLIICNHVLEHVPDDTKAMSEMYRTLKKGGTAILQVPIRATGGTYEDDEITTPEGRLAHFGQKDHVRIYGQDYLYRLARAGFDVDYMPLQEDYPQAGLNENEKLITVSK